jgi:small subunit ribosomal protein S20
LAHHKSAKKRIRQTAARRLRNRMARSTLRTAVKKVEMAIEAGQADQARASLLKATSLLDKAARKGLLHRNNASRRISRLTRKVNSLKQS